MRRRCGATEFLQQFPCHINNSANQRLHLGITGEGLGATTVFDSPSIYPPHPFAACAGAAEAARSDGAVRDGILGSALNYYQQGILLAVVKYLLTCFLSLLVGFLPPPTGSRLRRGADVGCGQGAWRAPVLLAAAA
jgi:hypothetical protein